MNDDTWLRDVLRAATSRQPPGDGRAAGALRRAALRRRQQVAAVSFSAVVAVFLASAVTGGSGGSAGLRPTTTSPSPTAGASEEPTASPSPYPEPGPGSSEDPDDIYGDPGDPKPHVAPVPNVNAFDPMPLDVYFLVDSAGNTEHADRAVPKAVGQITHRLEESGWNVAYGFGWYKDFTPLNGGRALVPVYQRIEPIAARSRRMPSIEYGGGGANPENAVTVGLNGALGHTYQFYVDEPQPAGFRLHARKVIVLVTATGINEWTEYPSTAETVANLRAAGVTVAALQVMGNADPELAYEDLSHLARATGGLTPEHTDCDGDGHQDLRPGDPLVCELLVGYPSSFTGFANMLLHLAVREQP